MAAAFSFCVNDIISKILQCFQITVYAFPLTGYAVFSQLFNQFGGIHIMLFVGLIPENFQQVQKLQLLIG